MADVFADGTSEGVALLWDDANAPAKRRQRYIGDIETVDINFPRRWRIKTEQEFNESRFAGATTPNEGNPLPWLHFKRDVLQDVDPHLLVAEGDVVKADMPP